MLIGSSLSEIFEPFFLYVSPIYFYSNFPLRVYLLYNYVVCVCLQVECDMCLKHEKLWPNFILFFFFFHLFSQLIFGVYFTLAHQQQQKILHEKKKVSTEFYHRTIFIKIYTLILYHFIFVCILGISWYVLHTNLYEQKKNIRKIGFVCTENVNKYQNICTWEMNIYVGFILKRMWE